MIFPFNRFSVLCEPISGSETPEILFERVLANTLEASFDESAHKVRIGTFENIEGLTPNFVILTGLVSGVVPRLPPKPASNDADSNAKYERLVQKILDDTMIKLSDAARKARLKLVFSYPQKCDSTTAKKLSIPVTRTRLKAGHTLAILTPSLLLEELKVCLSCTESGEQYLAKTTEID